MSMLQVHHGKRIPTPSMFLGGCRSHLIDSAAPFLRRLNLEAVSAKCHTQSTKGLSTPKVPPFENIQKDAEWISGIIAIWLNKEWTELDVHNDVGVAAALAYKEARKQGTEDMGDLVLELSSQLMSFNFGETFVGPFDVANKVVEFLMLRDGIDVCCTSNDDIDLLHKFNEEFQI